MTDSPDARALPPLSVDTDLTISVKGVDAAVDSTGERLLVQFGSVPDAFRALRNRPEGAQDRLGGFLSATDLTAEIRVRDRTVAVAGAEARPGAVSRFVGLDPIEVRIGGALGAVGAEAGGMLAGRRGR